MFASPHTQRSVDWGLKRTGVTFYLTLHRYLLLCNLPLRLLGIPSESKTPKTILVVSLVR